MIRAVRCASCATFRVTASHPIEIAFSDRILARHFSSSPRLHAIDLVRADDDPTHARCSICTFDAAQLATARAELDAAIAAGIDSIVAIEADGSMRVDPRPEIEPEIDAT